MEFIESECGHSKLAFEYYVYVWPKELNDEVISY